LFPLITRVSYGLADLDRARIGVLALFVGCFARWVYLNNKDRGYKGRMLLESTVLWTVILSMPLGLAFILESVVVVVVD
jgi:hypothetical protein